MYHGGLLRDISEVSEVGVTIIQQFTHQLSSGPSVDHAVSNNFLCERSFTLLVGGNL